MGTVKNGYILYSVAEKEPHHYGGAGAGAVTRCSSGSGSKLNDEQRWITINVINC
jgi:hypothetical protein